MKKKVLFRGLLGFLLGIVLAHITAIIVSAVEGSGFYQAAIPELVDGLGSELSSVIAQDLLYGVLGMILGSASAIWMIESWSLKKQTAVHFCLFAVSFTVVAYILYWIPRSAFGVIVSTVVFIILYGAVWSLIYAVNRRKA